MRLTETECRTAFAAARVARLATVGAEGAPHLVPVTFAVEGDRVYFAVDAKPKSSAHLRRLRNIAENPRVCLLADDYDEDWERLWWVRADGRARVLGEGGDRPRDLLRARYPQYADVALDGAVVEITVDRWSGWRYAEGH
ncbi:MAG TPA: TIGR03668 family PPOX class F420-dependent oxidoreductase [Actinospica sp.]|nr:TIGR03668 family PPOX class F420-dependent oxidoreductase [Actinospica sp.]